MAAPKTKENVFDKPIEFGTDGWRGRIARDFTFENVRKVAQAIADYVNNDRKLQRAPVLIGHDYRFQSDAFAAEIARVLVGNKIKVVMCDEVLPTPAISFLTRKLKCLGVMVTASHNPADYNGIKIKLDGRAAPVEVTKEVEQHLGKGYAVADSKIPRKSYKAQYLSYLKTKGNAAKVGAALKGKVVVDYMYGNAMGLFEELIPAKKMVALHAEKDPLFSGIHPEPVEENLQELAAAVKEHKAVAGLAFDGDADRFGLVDDKGRYITPCQIFPLFMDYLIETKKLSGKVVQSLSLGYLSDRIAKAHKLEFEEVPIGFKYIADKMMSEDVAFGGEESGGYAWKGTLPERDGMLSALLLLEILNHAKKPLSALLEDLEKRYGKSVFLRKDFEMTKTIPSKQAFTDRIFKKLPKKMLGAPIARTSTADGLKVYDEHGHWLLLRPSGTEPLLRIYAESDNPKKTEGLLDVGRKWCRHVLN